MKGKRIYDFVVTGGGCFAPRSDLIEKIKEKRADKKASQLAKKEMGKKPSVRDIKDARGIRVIPVTWNDDEATLCSSTSFIRNEGAPAPPPTANSQTTPRHELVLPAWVTMDPEPEPETVPIMLPSHFVNDPMESLSHRSSTTTMATQAFIDHTEGPFRQYIDEEENRVFQGLRGPGLFYSPIQNPKKILCMGPGTVTWAIEVAEKFPRAEVLCLDPRPYPRLMPRNCHVERSDLWEYEPTGNWDLVYIRNTRSPIFWPTLVVRGQCNAKIGGWLEMVDVERDGLVCLCESVLKCVPEQRCYNCDVHPSREVRSVWLESDDTLSQSFMLESKAAAGFDNRYDLESVTLCGQVKSHPQMGPRPSLASLPDSLDSGIGI